MLTVRESYEALYNGFRWNVPERYNIGADICDKWADGSEKPALVHETDDGDIHRYSFDKLRALSNRTANLFAAHGVRRGDRVAILLPQQPETALAHIAAYKIGAIAVPLFTLFGVDALRYRLSDSGAKLIVTDAAGAEKIAQIREHLPQLDVVLCVDGAARGAEDYHRLLHAASASFAVADTLAEDPALIIYTSGTTGAPKGALLPHRSLLGHMPGVEMSHDFLGVEGDLMWTPADWAWIGGLIDILFAGWHLGIPVVARRFAKFDAEEAFDLMARHAVRNVFMPPTALRMLRTVDNPARRWKLNLRSLASGGESLGVELLQWSRENLGLTINEFYGQTECNMTASSCSTLLDVKPGAIGKPAPGHRLAVIDRSGNVMPPGEQGSIAVHAPDPVMFLEYWNNETATREKFIGDWLVTGDLGVMDEQGYLTFVGRDDDVITSAGYRIGPGPIEDCLLSHPAVRNAAVVGKPDPQRTEIVAAFLVLREGYRPSEKLTRDLQQHVRSRLSAHEYPRQINYVDSLPQTATGKIIRRALRDADN
ncbi:MAG: AMP-dependent synthetase [Betaproteobacteria bacterium SG8_40]|nr:MAG: AMP-dependent synthetase [Betaproteobacteria bacterium SG8_40]